jgi:hypothetical protein
MQTVRFLKRWVQWPVGYVIRLPRALVQQLRRDGIVEVVRRDETATNMPSAEMADNRPHIPNRLTWKVLRDAEAGRDLHVANSVDDLFS